MNAKNIGIGIVVLAVIGIAVMQFGNMNKNTTQPEQTSLSQPSESTAAGSMEATSGMADENAGAMEASQYEDGTYEATGNYTSPAQEEEVEIVITLEDGVVVDAEFTGLATHETSIKLQGMFEEGFKEEVVGKNIDDIDLTVVNGSSLTPQGFMDALEKVKEEAKA